MHLVTLVNLGCWLESSTDRLIPLLESRSDFLGIPDYRSRPEALERCAIYASAYFYDTIAIFDEGACASSEKAWSLTTDFMCLSIKYLFFN